MGTTITLPRKDRKNRKDSDSHEETPAIMEVHSLDQTAADETPETPDDSNNATTVQDTLLRLTDLSSVKVYKPVPEITPFISLEDAQTKLTPDDLLDALNRGFRQKFMASIKADESLPWYDYETDKVIDMSELVPPAARFAVSRLIYKQVSADFDWFGPPQEEKEKDEEYEKRQQTPEFIAAKKEMQAKIREDVLKLFRTDPRYKRALAREIAKAQAKSVTSPTV